MPVLDMAPALATARAPVQAVHKSWQHPDQWQPERFMPGNEFDNFPDDIRPYMVATDVHCSLRQLADHPNALLHRGLMLRLLH